MSLGKFANGKRALYNTVNNKRSPDTVNIKSKSKPQNISDGQANEPLGNQGIIHRRHRIAGTSETPATRIGGTQKRFGNDHRVKIDDTGTDHLLCIRKYRHKNASKHNGGQRQGDIGHN